MVVDFLTGADKIALDLSEFALGAPGNFAAGDARYGSVKRVAGAVSEGSVCVGSVHRYLADAPALRTR